MAHRAEAQKVSGITNAQLVALALPRKKGFNYLSGIPKSDAHKRKTSEKNKAFWAAHPELAIARGEKTRGELHPLWKGGASKLSTSIRRMTEYRKWMGGVKARDGKCVRCGSIDNLESHHEPSFLSLLEALGVKTREDARLTPELWDISCGITLCYECHCAAHGKRLAEVGLRKSLFVKCVECQSTFKTVPSQQARFCCRSCVDAWRVKNPRVGADNPNWKGGLHSKNCVKCGVQFFMKAARVEERKFCSRECRYATQ
jgi:hypothetical protein